jgi:hypothetical protein
MTISKPIYKTNIKTLRFIVDNVFDPISVFFLMKAIRSRSQRKANIYHSIYTILDKPHSKWGTTWNVTFDVRESIDDIEEVW